MKLNRIGRIVVCLLLICCLTFHAMIPRAEASSIGAAATIVKASTVTCNPYIIAGATLIALGVYAGVETGAFETVANNCVNALQTAGTWIKDGAMELLRTEDADGNASYYVDSGLMEDVRGIVTSDSGFVVASTKYNSHYTTASCTSYSQAFSYALHCREAYDCYNSQGIRCIVVCNDSSSYVSFDSGNLVINGTGTNHSVYKGGTNWITCTNSSKYYYYNAVKMSTAPLWSTTHDLTLGNIPSVSVDGTSARQWSEDYTDRGLKVYGGGSGNNNNNGKWFWPVVLVAGADLLAMSQADAWAGETPQEFDDYDTKEELKVVDTPEVEFGFGIVFEPDSGDTEDPTQSTEPTIPGDLPDIGGGDNPDTGGDTDGDTGSDTGTESGNQTDYTSWFQKIIKGIEELPSKFESWITDCKTAIEELPSKFAEWFNSIIEKLSSIWETLKSIPQTILDGLRQLLSDLFVPSADYIPNKVNSLYEKYPYMETFKDLGLDLKNFLIGLGVSPPIIYIDLSSARNSYFWGGREIFIDLSWYAEYKPTMDAIIGGFLWLWFAWRLWQSLPGLIQGTSGMWGDGTTVPDFTFHMPKFQQGSNWLNSGSSYHGRGTASKWKKDGG